MMRALGGLLLAVLAMPAAAETFRLRAPTETLEAVMTINCHAPLVHDNGSQPK